jgi:hypothetical protein
VIWVSSDRSGMATFVGTVLSNLLFARGKA